MHALEVGDLRLVAGLHEGVEAGLDQGADAAAQDGLLAEEIGLGLFRERRLDDPGPREAERLGVGEGQCLRLSGSVLLDGDQGRRATPLEVDLAHPVTGRLRGDQRYVDVGGRLDGLEADVEAVREHQHLARAQVRRDLLRVDAGLPGIRGQDHDHVRPGRGVAPRNDGQALGFGSRPRAAAGVEGHLHRNAAVPQVERVGMPLRSVPEDGDLLRLNESEVRRIVVVDGGHLSVFPSGVFAAAGGARQPCGIQIESGRGAGPDPASAPPKVMPGAAAGGRGTGRPETAARSPEAGRVYTE